MSRRLAREKAMQILFQIDVGKTDKDLAMSSILEDNILSKNDREFVYSLIEGICSTIDIIDDHIRNLALDWKIERLANVDRSILRIAVYEMYFLAKDVPWNVSINEAVELAKKFSTTDSSKYVNGILNSFKKQLEQKSVIK